MPLDSLNIYSKLGLLMAKYQWSGQTVGGMLFQGNIYAAVTAVNNMSKKMNWKRTNYKKNYTKKAILILLLEMDIKISCKRITK